MSPDRPKPPPRRPPAQRRVRTTPRPKGGSAWATFGLASAVGVFGTLSLAVIAVVGFQVIRSVRGGPDIERDVFVAADTPDFQTGPSVPPGDGRADDNDENEPPPNRAAENRDPQDVPPADIPADPAEAEPMAPVEDPMSDVETDDNSVPSADDAGDAADEAMKVPVQDAQLLEDLEQLRRQESLPLPPLGGTIVTDDVTLLAAWSSDTGRDNLALSLVGTDKVYGEEDNVSLRRVENELAWAVAISRPQGVVGEQEIGRFSLREEGLCYSWSRFAGSHPAAKRLRYCLLKIDAGDQTIVCRLGESQTIESPELNLFVQKLRLEIPIDADDLPPKQHLRMDVRFEGFRRAIRLPDRAIAVDEKLLAGLFEDTQEVEDKPGIEVEATFECDKEPSLMLSALAYPNRFDESIEQFDPVPTDGRTLSKLGRAAARAKRQLEKEIAKLQNDKKALENIEDELAARARGANNEQAERLADQQDKNRNDQLDVEEGIDEAMEESDQIERRDELVKRFRKILNELKEEECLQFRMYFEIGEREIEICRTKGFRS